MDDALGVLGLLAAIAVFVVIFRAERRLMRNLMRDAYGDPEALRAAGKAERASWGPYRLRFWPWVLLPLAVGVGGYSLVVLFQHG